MIQWGAFLSILSFKRTFSEDDLVIEILGKDHEMSYFTPSESCKIFVTGTSCFQEVKYRPTVPPQLRDWKLFVFLWQAINFALDRLPTDIWGVCSYVLLPRVAVFIYSPSSFNFSSINWLYYAYKNNCWLLRCIFIFLRHIYNVSKSGGFESVRVFIYQRWLVIGFMFKNQTSRLDNRNRSCSSFWSCWKTARKPLNTSTKVT